MDEIDISRLDIKGENEIKLKKPRKPRRTKLEMQAAKLAEAKLAVAQENEIPKEKEHIVYQKTYEQKESSKRQKNTQNWQTLYGIYVDPTNQEDYYWFKQNACLVRKLLPIIKKVTELQIPFNERE